MEGMGSILRLIYVSDSCWAIDIQCASCNVQNVSECTYCSMGYGLDLNSSANICRNCSVTCLTCSTSDYSSCQSCPPSSYLLGNTCYPCSSNCINCTDINSCTNCSNGYYLSPLGNCYLCSDGCSMCIWNGTYTKV